MSTVFTKIIAGEIPCHKIAENDQFIAFLDINPLRYGHTLVVPKVEVDYIFDLDPENLSGIMVFAKKVAKAIEKEFECNRIGVTVIGLEVPHAHVHLIPIDSVLDMDFSRPKMPHEPEKFDAIALRIAQHL